MKKPKIGVSACLLGHNVRFNGSNCHKKFITQVLSQFLNYKKICPEMSAKMGVPRTAVFQIERKDGDPIILSHDEPKTDHTEALNQACSSILKQTEGVAGFILKRGSPSCAIKTAKVYNEKYNILRHNGDGLFTSALKKAHPHMPIEDEGRLNDPVIKEHFIKQVYLYHEALEMLEHATQLDDLIQFHTHHKMLLRLHNQTNQKKLGRLLTQHQDILFNDLKQQYFDLFVQSFNKIVTANQHFAILQRCFRGINKLLTKADRADIQSNIKAYLKHIVPLAVPVSLLRHYAKRYEQTFIVNQSYLQPYPEELGLMAHV